MKINFNQPFKNYKGEVIIEDNGAPQLIKNVVSALLFSGKWLERKANAKPEEKVMAYDLSIRVYKSMEELEINIEEAAMIKEAVTSLNPGGYVQVINLIEGK
ncbi:hypothetical protein [Bacteroides stercoris]|jgi:hypothetical protein|uniref:hypothetical protein n=1 Tax=Bacteroides stercoris TaxID=46506 RepID=UPI0020575728|nr:MAG TPA: hypothetical protein [Bacteriophage sp.]